MAWQLGKMLEFDYAADEVYKCPAARHLPGSRQVMVVAHDMQNWRLNQFRGDVPVFDPFN